MDTETVELHRRVRSWGITGRAVVAALAIVGGLLGAPSREAHAQQPAPTPTPSTLEEGADPLLAPPPPAPRAIRSWEEALSLVRARSPDYRTSQDAIARASAQTRIALAALLPTVTGQASYTHQFFTETIPFGGASLVTPPQNVAGLGASLSWTPVNARAIYGVGTAERNVDVAQLAFEDRRRQLAAATVDAILATLAAERVADLNRVGLRTALERLVLTQTRLKYAQGIALDVDRAQQDVAAARVVLINGDEQLRQSRESLGFVLGSSSPIAPPSDMDLDAFERAVAATCHLNEDIERRPDIVAARARVDVAQRLIRDAELMTAPTLGVQSQLAYNSEVAFGPLTTWSVSGVIIVPFYDGGARYGMLRDNRAAADQAQQALVAARLSAVVASARAHRAVGVTAAARDQARQQRDLSARVDQRTRDGYAHGLGTSLDLVTSAQALRQAEINLAVLEFQVAEARANAVLANAECVY
jgi:outer membrane protein, multidrug efflux system